MRRLHLGTTIGVAAASLVLTALVGTAGAVEDPPATEARARGKGPSEVRGSAASSNAMRSGRLSCGQVITRSTTLTADVGPCPGNGIIIGADNIRLNLNGHTVSGTPGAGDGNAAGIRLPFRTGVTITGHPGKSGKTGTVTGFDAGVVINGGSGNRIENLVVRDNIGPRIGADLGDGILILSSNNNIVARNVVTHNGPYDGIGLVGTSDSNRIEGNTVEDNDVPGTIRAPDGPPREIQVDKGISVGELEDSITNTTLLNNEIRRSGADGVYVTGSGSVISDNVSEDNGFLADVFSVPASGIRLLDTADNTTVQNNRVFRNAVYGIGVASEGNRIIGNVAFDNGGGAARGRGADLADFHGSCTENLWQGNTFGTAYPDCIYEQHGQRPPPPDDGGGLPPDDGGGLPPDDGGGLPPDDGGDPIIGP